MTWKTLHPFSSSAADSVKKEYNRKATDTDARPLHHTRPDQTKLPTCEEDKAAAEEQSARANEAATVPGYSRARVAVALHLD